MMTRFLKKLLLFFIVFTPLFLQADGIEKPKKKLLVLCSTGGYGHMAAASTLKTLLNDQYEFNVIFPIDELRIWGVNSGEEIYNWMLRSGWIRSVNMITGHMAPKLFRTRKKKIEALIYQQIRQEKPDLVISLIPFINCPASEAARKAGVPYLIVTTDNDLRNWVHGLQGVSHPHFKVTVGSDLWCSREMLRKRNIPDSAIATIGLPVRPDFFVKRDPELLRAQYKIPAQKPIVLVIIGGQGGSAALQYAETIGSKQLGVHLIVCAGKNKELAEDLRELKLHPMNSMTVMEFTDKVPELMALADLIITKPGPGTITEAMAMRLPILIDNTTPILTWEKANIDMIMHYGIGDYIDNFEEVETLLREFLFDSELRQSMQASYKRIPENRFNQAIAPLIAELVSYKADSYE